MYCRQTHSLHAVQGGDGQWLMGRAEAALKDKREYQLMLSEGRRKRVEGSSDQLHKVRHIVPSDNAVGNGVYHIIQQLLQLERAREVEQRLMTELQQLKEQATREKEQVTREKERMTRETEQVTREKEQVC